MNKRWSVPLGVVAVFVLVLTLGREAQALKVPHSIEEALVMHHGLRPLHLFFGFVGFGLLAIIARYAEWRGWLVFTTGFLSLACIGTCLVWVLVYGIDKQSGSRALLTASRDADQALLKHPMHLEPRIAATGRAANANVGETCRTASDCVAGALCEKIAGKKKCWHPCGEDGACPSGFACFPTGQGSTRVCAR